MLDNQGELNSKRGQGRRPGIFDTCGTGAVFAFAFCAEEERGEERGAK